MNKKGFTLVELLGAMVILGIIITIAGGVYTKVYDNQKEHTYQNKVSTIELAAEKWAEETNLSRTTTITVKRLVAESFYQADEYDEENTIMVVNDPRDDSSMLCNTIDVVVEDGSVKAKFTGEKDCDLSNKEEERAKVKIAAYEYDIVTKKVLKTLKDRDNPNTLLPWTRHAVLLVVEPTEEGYKDYTKVIYTNGAYSETKEVKEFNKISIEDLKKENIDPTKYANTYLVDTEVLLNTEYNIAIDLPKNGDNDKIYGLKSNDIIVRIDKEAPSLTYEFEKEYTTVDKELTLKASDGAGSGLKTFYVYDVDGKLINNPNNFNAEENNNTMKLTLKEGVYTVYAEDNVGNKNELPEIVKMINIASEPPNCSFTLDRSPDYNGWYNRKVTLTFRITEPGSVGYTYYFGTSSTPTYSNGVASGFSTTEVSKSITLDTGIHKYYGYIKTSLGLTNVCNISFNVDTVIPPAPTITSSDGKPSGKFHKDPFTLTASVSPGNLSGNIYYYGTTNNPTSLDKITVQEVPREYKDGQYWYAKACSGAGLCSTVSSYMAKSLEIKPGGYIKYVNKGPCKLEDWRVISVNEEKETFEMMSVSACGSITLGGEDDFKNSLRTFQNWAKKFETAGVTTGSRFFGYNGQSLTMSTGGSEVNEWSNNNKDVVAAKDVFGNLKAGKEYWVAMRKKSWEATWEENHDGQTIIKECNKTADHQVWYIKTNGEARGDENLYCRCGGDCDPECTKTKAGRVIISSTYDAITSGGDGSSKDEALILGGQ